MAQAIILGDRQPYTGVLVAPDFDELRGWARTNGLGDAGPDALIAEKAVHKLLDHEVRTKLEDFAIFERPRRVALLPRLLTEEEGELTPSMKVKLRVVKDRWADKVAEHNQLEALVTLLAVYVGFPRASAGMEVVRDELARLEDQG